MPLYNGTIVSDHEKTFLEQGSKHQECLTHVSRYAKGVAELEPDKEWAGRMQEWIKEAIGRRNETVAEGGEKIENSDELKKKFHDILVKADSEFRDSPPAEGLRDAYNLFKRMQDKPGDYLLFLDDLTVPPTNNDAERAGRKFKRKAHQVMAFRSMDGVVYFCDGLTVIESLRAQGKNVYNEVALIFNDSMPKERSEKKTA